MNALIIVDVQNDFLPGGALPVQQGNDVIPVINTLQNKFDIVVATQDWHPLDHKSFASSHPGKKVFEQIILNGLPQVLWPEHCVQELTGASFSPLLDTRPIEAIFRKGTDKNIDSYSGFFDNGKKKATGMAPYLKGRNVNHIYVAGLAADYCVNFTALDGLELGFECTIIADGTRAINIENMPNILENFLSKGGQVKSANEINF